MSGINASDFSKFQQQAQHLQELGKNSPGEIKTDDIKEVAAYLSSDDAKKNLTAGQIDKFETALKNLQVDTDSATPSHLDLTSEEGKSALNHELDGLVSDIAAADGHGNGPKMAEGIKDATGASIDNIPASSALSDAAKAPGSTVTPVKQADGKSSDLFVVKDKDGNNTLFGRDGAKLGSAKPGETFSAEITNPAPGQDKFIGIGPSGNVATANSLAELGATESSTSTNRIQITGNGANGGYDVRPNPNLNSPGYLFKSEAKL